MTRRQRRAHLLLWLVLGTLTLVGLFAGLAVAP